MRTIDRTPIATGDPVDSDALTDHLRIELVEAMSALRYARAAARELEQYAGIALLTQEIVAQSDPFPGAVLSLPIGPSDPETEPTVEYIAPDGTATTATGWTIRHGLRPVLTFALEPVSAVRVTYRAGYGETAASIPDDLSLAVLDQALRTYDMRGDPEDHPRLAPSSARIAARYRQVRLTA